MQRDTARRKSTETLARDGALIAAVTRPVAITALALEQQIPMSMQPP